MKQWDFETNFSHYDRNLKLDEKLTAAVEGQCEFIDRNRFVQNLQMAGIGKVSTDFPYNTENKVGYVFLMVIWSEVRRTPRYSMNYTE